MCEKYKKGCDMAKGQYESSLLKKSLNAFTLVELLVVISIIALLLSIMMPALRKARMSARSTICKTNLRSQHLAISAYAANYNGRFPINYASKAACLKGWSGQYIPHSMSSISVLLEGDYLPESKIFNCPVAQQKGIYQSELKKGSVIREGEVIYSIYKGISKEATKKLVGVPRKTDYFYLAGQFADTTTPTIARGLDAKGNPVVFSDYCHGNWTGKLAAGNHSPSGFDWFDYRCKGSNSARIDGSVIWRDLDKLDIMWRFGSSYIFYW